MLKLSGRGALAGLAALILLAASAAPAAAQGPGRGPREGGPGDEELRETIEIYMLSKMKTELELTTEQEEELVPLVQEMSAARQRHRHQRRLALMSLQPLVDDPSSSDAAIRAQLDGLAEAEKSFRETERASMEKIREILSPRQEAGFILFLERFMQDMQQRLRRMRQMHGDGAPGMRRRGQGPGRP